ncbi:unnamed protein product [Cuscuta europaea]|uniref:Uncharacterized protein n=1 Tax=Cuscuta europaea TaxID=41803 RepID=A0A9P0ZV06_CUSEU|nr:unnamed protein product [Cuscuta europaea]
MIPPIRVAKGSAKEFYHPGLPFQPGRRRTQPMKRNDKFSCEELNRHSGAFVLLFEKVVMMLSAGYFRNRSDLPGAVWTYPISDIAFHTYSIQGVLENEYIGTSFAVGPERSISGEEAIRNVYQISGDSNAKWKHLLSTIHNPSMFPLKEKTIKSNDFSHGPSPPLPFSHGQRISR